MPVAAGHASCSFFNVGETPQRLQGPHFGGNAHHLMSKISKLEDLKILRFFQGAKQTDIFERTNLNLNISKALAFPI